MANGTRDPIESIRVAHAKSALHNIDYETLLQVYRSLSTDEAQRVATWAIHGLPPTPENRSYDRGSEDDIERDRVLLMLACLVPDALKPIHHTLAEQSIFNPPILYWGADSATRDLLLSAYATEESERVRFRLADALSWIGDDVVAAYCKEQAIDAKQLEAGWEILPDGRCRRPWVDKCIALTRTPAGTSTTDDDPLNVGVQQEEHCEWCGKLLTTLFDLRPSNEQMAFLGLAGDRVRIAMCDTCTWYGTIFTDIDLHGSSTWSSYNIRPEYIGGGADDRLLERQATLGRVRRTPVEAYWDL